MAYWSKTNLVVIAAFALACGARSQASTSAGGGSGDTTTTTVTSDTTSSESSDTGIPPDCFPSEGAENCEPPGPASLSWTQTAGDGDGTVVSSSCVVDQANNAGNTQTLQFACDGPLVGITLTTSEGVFIAVSEGQSVQVSTLVMLTSEVPERWIRVEDPSGTLLFAAVDAETLHPQGVEFAWSAPVPLMTLPEYVCPGEYALDECVVVERVGIQASFGGETDIVFDGDTMALGELDGYFIVVDRAENANCVNAQSASGTDCGFNTPPTRYHIGVTYLSEG